MIIDLIELGDDGEGISVTYDDMDKHINIEASFEGGYCGGCEDIDVRDIPYVQELGKENVALKNEISELKERVQDLYFGKEPNYESEVLMSKIEVLEEKISELEDRHEMDMEDIKYYKDKYNQMYYLIIED